MNQLKMAGKRWSIEEDENLKKEITNNLNINEIAINHQRTVTSIKCRKLELAYKEYEKGQTDSPIICLKFKINHEDLHNWISKKRNKQINKVTKEKIINKTSKKRGRKPKQNLNIDDINKISKKRGRKPKQNLNIDDINYLRQDIFEIKNSILLIHKKLDEIIDTNNAIYEFENE